MRVMSKQLHFKYLSSQPGLNRNILAAWNSCNIKSGREARCRVHDDMTVGKSPFPSLGKQKLVCCSQPSYLQQSCVCVRDDGRESPPLLDALDAGRLDQLLHGVQSLLVGVAEGEEPAEQVEPGAVVLRADGLCLGGGFLHGRPVLHPPGIL